MRPVPDYTFYTGTYHGTLGEDAFNAQLPGASAYVSWLVGFNEPDQDTEPAYKRAVCAVVDSFAEYGKDTPVGFTIGSFRIEGSVDTGACERTSRSAAEYELAGTGLLFQGIA